jgi:hypothetical protein
MSTSTSFASLALVAASFASVSAFAQVGTIDTYCGQPITGGSTDLGVDAPVVVSLKVTSSTNTKVKQVVSKFGKHDLTFTYEDGSHIYRIALAVAAHFENNSSTTPFCIDGEATTLSRWGTPVEILPVLP